MNITSNDGTVNYAEIFKKDDYDWNMIVRKDGSVSVYGTRPYGAYHRVVFDTLDNKPPDAFAAEIIARIKAEAIKAEVFAQAFRNLEKDIENGEK